MRFCAKCRLRQRRQRDAIRNRRRRRRRREVSLAFSFIFPTCKSTTSHFVQYVIRIVFFLHILEIGDRFVYMHVPSSHRFGFLRIL